MLHSQPVSSSYRPARHDGARHIIDKDGNVTIPQKSIDASLAWQVQQRMEQAKAEMDSETESARQTIQSSAGELANQVVRAVLPMAAGSSR